jgi:hypothetical protein
MANNRRESGECRLLGLRVKQRLFQITSAVGYSMQVLGTDIARMKLLKRVRACLDADCDLP